jgi:hypothetical protein
VDIFMKKVMLIVMMTLTVYGCLNTLVVTNQEFQHLKPFEATVLSLEQIPLDDSESVLTAMTVDYRVKLKRKDGVIIVIKRVSAIGGISLDFPGTMPHRMFQPTLKIGKTYTFPCDLYIVHPDD